MQHGKSPSMPPSLFLNDFTVLDFAYIDAKLGITGDSYYVSAELEGELDQKDFLLDFSQAKKTLKSLVDEAFDHKLLVPMGAGVTALSETGLTVRSTDGFLWEYTCPKVAYAIFPEAEITPEVLQDHLARHALAKMPPNVKEVKFFLRSPQRFQTEANFRYTHGLRFHEGNCQRLFHGHRNPIEVFVNGARSADWEARLAKEWANVHFVAAPTLKNRAELVLPIGLRICESKILTTACVEYASAQGEFRARIPASRIVITDAEPSIETMSLLAIERLRAWGAPGSLRVVAYEGLNKGASSSC